MMATNDFSQILNARKYDPGIIPKPENILFKIQGKTIGTIENYCVFSGLPKTGKSTFISALLGSAYVPDNADIFSMKLTPIKDRNRIAYFDTESSTHDFYRQIDRIKKFAMRENLPHTLDAYNCREDQPKDIRNIIEYYLKNNAECSVLVIDGFLDLCYNYNDEVETRILTNWFKYITKKYQILLIGVLHLGKGGNETLGHLGSNSDRWSQSTLIIEKNKNTKQYVLKSKFLRSADDIDEIAIMNFAGSWVQVEYQADIPIKTNKKGSGK